MGFLGKGYTEGFARRTAVELTFNGIDITNEAAMDLLSFSWTDSEGETDNLELQLQDRNHIWLQKWLSASVNNIGLEISAKITYYNGRGGSTSVETGKFELDSVQADGGSSGSTVTISGTSLDYGSSLRKTEKDKSWENYTLQGIASELAGTGGLELVYETSSNPEYELAEQDGETDVEFLERLCEAAGLSLKFAAGQMIIYDIADYEAKDAVRTVNMKDGTYTDYSLQTGEAETAYTSVEVRYTDPATGTVYDEVYVDDSSADEDEDEANRLVVTYLAVTSASDALEKAEYLCRLHNQFQKTAEFTVPGDPNAAVALCWEIAGFGLWDGKYIITQATHTVDSSGYRTSVSLRACGS